MATVEERLDATERRLDMFEYYFGLLFEGANTDSHRIWRLETYTSDELEACREAMYTWVESVHKNITEFRDELYKRKGGRMGR